MARQCASTELLAQKTWVLDNQRRALVPSLGYRPPGRDNL